MSWVEKVRRQYRQNGRAERIEPRHGRLNNRVDEATQAMLAGGAGSAAGGWLRCPALARGATFLRRTPMRLSAFHTCATHRRIPRRSARIFSNSAKVRSAHRQEFIAKIQATPPEHLIFLDESGVTTATARLYARRPEFPKLALPKDIAF